MPTEMRGRKFIATRGDLMMAMIDACSLIDMEATGLKYSWYKKQVGEVIMKRLDRALVDQPYRLAFPEAFVENLCRVYSNHCLMLIKCKGMQKPHGKRPFRFQAAWVTYNQYDGVVCIAWAKGSPNVLRGLTKVQNSSFNFNKKKYLGISLGENGRLRDDSRGCN